MKTRASRWLAAGLVAMAAGCWPSTSTDEPAIDTQEVGAAPSGPAAEAAKLRPDGTMVTVVLKPFAEIDAKVWQLAEGGAARFNASAPEGAPDALEAFKQSVAESIEELGLGDDIEATTWAEAVSAAGVDASQPVFAYLRPEEGSADMSELENGTYAIRVPATDAEKLIASLGRIEEDVEIGEDTTPGGQSVTTATFEEEYSYTANLGTHVIISNNMEWIDDIVAKASAPADLPFAVALTPDNGETDADATLIYDGRVAAEIMEALQEETDEDEEDGSDSVSTDNDLEWSVVELRVQEDGVFAKAHSQFVEGSPYIADGDVALDLLPYVPDNAAVVVGLRLQKSAREAMMADLGMLSVVNPMAAGAVAGAAPWMTILDDEIILSSTGVMGFVPVLAGVAEISDPQKFKDLLVEMEAPVIESSPIGDVPVDQIPLGFFSIQHAFIGNTLVMSTDRKLFENTAAQVKQGDKPVTANLLQGVAPNSDLIIAGDVAVIEQAVAPFAGGAMNVVGEGALSDVLKRFVIYQYRDGRDQHFSLSLQGDPGLAIIRSVMDSPDEIATQ